MASLSSMSEYELRGWGYWPNRWAYNPRSKIGVISCFQGAGGDWSVNRSLLQQAIYFIVQCDWQITVRLLDKNHSVVNETSAARLCFLLELLPNLGSPEFGEFYYWVNAQFEFMPVQSSAGITTLISSR